MAISNFEPKNVDREMSAIDKFKHKCVSSRFKVSQCIGISGVTLSQTLRHQIIIICCGFGVRHFDDILSY